MSSTCHTPTRTIKTGLLLLLATVLPAIGVAQTDIYLQDYQQLSANVCPNNTIAIYDDGGPSYNYSDFFNGSIVLTAPVGSRVVLSGNYDTYQRGGDYLKIYNGTGPSAQCIATYRGTGQINFTSPGRTVNLVFRSYGYATRPGFEITATATGSVNCQQYAVSGLSVTNLSAHQASFAWHANTAITTYKVSVGNTITHYTRDTAITVTDLNSSTNYLASVSDSAHSAAVCCADRVSFNTPCSSSVCTQFDFTDLTSCAVTCTTGDFNNPYNTIGVVDYGASNNLTRHTVMRDTTGYDTLGGQLRYIPVGETASVRLGNAFGGGLAESITYDLLVDTTLSDLLLLKYAAVLQNPSHSYSHQPKFTFQITDHLGNEIDTSCYSAEFVSNTSLGWNTGPNGVLWKDWTTIGISLNQLHGRLIRVRLTTYDCAEGGHFGYAYFVLRATDKQVTSSSCGATVENTFTAPDGFSYRWYPANNPDTTLSTSQSLHVTTSGTYACRLSFAGRHSSNCHTTVQVLASPRYPYARLDYETDTLDCHYSVQFHNHSIITTDSLHTQPTNFHCESHYWDFGDGSTSTEKNPTHTYLPGNYSGYMVAMLANGQCRDTARFSLSLPSFPNCHDTIDTFFCRNQYYRFYDTIITQPGIYHRTVQYHSHTLILSVRDTSESYLSDTIVENQLPWRFLNSIYKTSVSDDLHYLYNQNADGCDSVIHYSLVVWKNDTTATDSTICQGQLPIRWESRTVTLADLNPDSICGCFAGTLTDTLHTVHESDSLLVLHLKVFPTAQITLHDTICQGCRLIFHSRECFLSGIYCDTLSTIHSCDSIVTLNLHVRDSIQTSTNITFTCTSPAHYTLHASAIPNDAILFWHSIPADSFLDTIQTSSPSIVSAAPRQSGLYILSAKYPSGLPCPITDTLTLALIDTIKARLSLSPDHFTFDAPEFTAIDRTPNSTERTWYFQGEEQNDHSRAVKGIADASTDSLRVTLEVSNGVCHDTISRPLPLRRTALYFPNIFAPDQPTNRLFLPQGTGIIEYELWVYTRLGLLVFHTTDLSHGWDGTYHGTPCPPGSYAYYCRYRDTTHTLPITADGQVTLLR